MRTNTETEIPKQLILAELAHAPMPRLKSVVSGKLQQVIESAYAELKKDGKITERGEAEEAFVSVPSPAKAAIPS